MRTQQSLSGSWQFGIDPEGTGTPVSVHFDRRITVPMPWQAVFPDLQHYSGYAWYRRSIHLDAQWLAGEVLLQFGAVDYWCQVFVNGQLAGEHEGGYTPFTIPIRRYLQSGENDITVRVYDSAQEGFSTPRWGQSATHEGKSGPPFNAEDIPHGKQEWYLNVGGIWQDVFLTAVPQRWIDHLRVTPDIHTGEMHVEIELAGAHNGRSGDKILVRAGDGESPEAITETPIVANQDRHTLTLALKQPRLWTLEEPHLYTVTATLAGDGPSPDDEVSARVGFRELRAHEGRFLLNNEPVYLLAALDQDIYPETIYTVPSVEFLRDQFRKAKELGFNCLRCHIKPPDPIYLDLADEMGLLIWEEIPSWRTFYIKGTRDPDQLNLGDTIKKRVEATLRDMVRRDYNHPSVVIWTIVNEDWGTTLPLSASDRRWVSQMYDLCKQLDATRLVVDDSPCPHPWGPSIHVHTDIDDFHFYTNIPDQAASWEATVEQINMRPLWTFSSFGDAQRTGHEPLVLSEFGNWGLPGLRNLGNVHRAGEPPWFGIGPWWNAWEGEAGWPEGVQTRFKRLGLDAMWPDFDAYAEATQWHQFGALKFEIEALRRQPNVAGYVITELADIYWESNGVLDFNRNHKIYHALFPTINSSDMVVPRVASYACWDNEVVRARLYLSHYGKDDWRDARLRWSLGGDEGELVVPNLERGAVVDLGSQVLSVPKVSVAGAMQAMFTLLNGDGSRLARNTLDLVVYPAGTRQTDMREPVVVSASLGEAVHALGYATTEQLSSEVRLAVTGYPNSELLKWVRDGGRLLFIARGPSPFFWVQSRGGAYSGAWLTSYSWIRPDIHRRIKVDNPLGLPFREVMPSATMLGIPMEDPAIHGDVLAGMTSGWVGHPSAHTVQFRYGKGRVIMTAFNLVDGLGSQPVATAMFHDLLDYLVSDACLPTLRANY